ncbi:hypothetical protein QE152_g5007 [Popillia japonica]|uniref:Reverse transcriptase domain-containing protein n=1 Tax=Popillia japonica TaxID=7064 RepID=A0AAW1MYN1_POPJA
MVSEGVLYSFSDLSDRYQRVMLNNKGKTYSSQRTINNCRIAPRQYSWSCPVRNFGNDLLAESVESGVGICCYGDDINLVVAASDFNELVNRGVEIFRKTTEWVSTNQLVMNKQKTASIIFKTKQNKLIRPSILARDCKIDIGQEIKFLGIYIDEHLDWVSQIEQFLKT